MTALAIILAPFVLVGIAYLARATRGQRREIDRRRLEAMDERRAAANLYPLERHLEAAPQHAPDPPTPAA